LTKLSFDVKLGFGLPLWVIPSLANFYISNLLQLFCNILFKALLIDKRLVSSALIMSNGCLNQIMLVRSIVRLLVRPSSCFFVLSLINLFSRLV